MAYSSYTNEDGTKTYFDIDDPTKTYSSPPTGQTQQYDSGTQTYADGTPKYFNPSDKNDIENVRSGYQGFAGLSDDAVVAKLKSLLGGDISRFQLGSNAPGLTHIVDNSKEGFDRWAPLLAGGLAAAGGLGLFGAEALGGAGAGIGGGAGGGALAEAGLGGAGLTQAELAAASGGGLSAATASPLTSLTNLLTPSPTSVATSLAQQLAQNGGGSNALSEASNTSPSGIPNYETGYVPNVQYGNSDPLVNNPSTFGTGDPYDVGQNLVNNPSTFNPSGTPAGAQSALSRLINGNATAADYAQIAGALGTTGVGILSANSQANTLKGIYDQQRADRAPSLAAYNTALANPDTFYNSAPAMGSVDAVLRKLSVNGNPAANPGDLSKAAAYNLGGYTNYLGALSGPAFGGQATQAQLGTGIAGTQASMGNALGGGLTNLTTPTNDWSSILSQLGKISLNNGMSPP